MERNHLKSGSIGTFACQPGTHPTWFLGVLGEEDVGAATPPNLLIFHRLRCVRLQCVSLYGFMDYMI